MSKVQSRSLSFASTLVDRLRLRSEISPDRTAYIFLRENGSEIHRTYRELDLEARKIAAWLQHERLSGERVLLVYPQGLDYVAAFLGCLYGGSIAVPVYPPRMNRQFQRIATVVQDCRPSAALTARALLSKIQSAKHREPGLNSFPWLVSEEVDPHLAARWVEPELDARDIAFLQYTSGSTAQPKGVIVSHGNLTSNERMIQDAFGVNEDSVIAGWLPLFHDMGLIGNVLQALWAGACCVLLSPERFLRQPFDWLSAVTRYRATISGAPNFAFDLCTTKIAAEQLAALDLSSWRVAFNGSEPVRAQTMADFSEKFSRCGFDRKAFFPCYGLAEATLFVSGKGSDAPRTVSVSSDALARHEFVASDGNEDQARVLVSCGSAGMNEEIAIVDPDRLEMCSAGKVGEIWVKGDNISHGYWNQPEINQPVFQAFTAQGQGPYLRTGDLGCLSNGELFITGRIKDLIIVRGRNHYPQDLEFTVSRSHPAFANGACAAFTVEIAETTEAVLLQEVTSKFDHLEDLLRTAVQSIAEEHDIRMHTVGLVQARSLPKTSSGKIRRQECRRQFLNSELKLLAVTGPTGTAPNGLSPAAHDVPADYGCNYADAIEEAVATVAAELLKRSSNEIDVEAPLTTYGLDSLQAAELNNRVARIWNIELPLEELLGAPTIRSIAAVVRTDQHCGAKPLHDIIRNAAGGHEWPLSYGQRALFYLYKLAPEAAAYHIPLALHLRGPLDVTALRHAMDALVQRHECLRSVFTTGADGTVQRLAPLPLPLHVEDADGWTDRQIHLQLMDEARRPFNLDQGPLFRAILFARQGDEHVLLLVFHHIVTDFASLVLLFEDLKRLYAELRRGEQCERPVSPYRYADFTQWQQQMLRGERGKVLKDYWGRQLSDGLPVLRLPTDHPRPPVQSYRGQTLNRRIDETTASSIQRLARTEGVTLFTLLTAAFLIFLYRYTSQSEIVLGTPVSGRTHPRWSGLPGYFINQIVLRANVKGECRFSNFLAQIRSLVRDGLTHQDYPLALIAEDLQPERDPAYPALFQVMFSLQDSGPDHDESLAALALGDPGSQIQFDNLQMDSFPFSHETTQLDLTLSMARIEGGFVASFRYNSDLFEHSTAARMATHFKTLLQDIAAHPNCWISELQMIPEEEKLYLLEELNATSREYSQELRIHELFSSRARQQGNSIAVIGGDDELTYAELEEKSDQLASRLRCKGVRPGAIVGLFIERRSSLLIGILGILKSGAAYLPMDPLLPDERVRYMVGDAGICLIVSQQNYVARLQPHGAEIICVETTEWRGLEETQPVGQPGCSEQLAYVMYTSGSTGKPKGVMVTHRSVVNFFRAMDERIGCTPQDTLLAVTAISFDISVLELLWTLTRGAKVVLADLAIPAHPALAKISAPELDYSLFYFASADEQQASNKYELLMEGAKFADRNGFSAVWTPERHFHPFGGLYPNPAVTGAALAAITERVRIRAGSVVLPLHDVIRVAEEWSVVDNLSGGRTGLAFASGWHADDFVFAPQNYASRKEVMFQAIETFLKLWRGESVAVESGSGKRIEVKIFPKPRQHRPPLWLTAAGTPETFVRAGQIGANILTHLLGQSIEDVAEKVRLYRASLAKHGHNPDGGQVTLMLHTFLGESHERVKDQVRVPFTNYLRSSVDLIRNLVKSANLPLDFENLTAKDMDDILAFAFERYFETSSLFGTVKSCQTMVEKLKWAGVNEVACLIDFGVENQAALGSLSYIPALKRAMTDSVHFAPRSVAELAMTYKPTLMQCTPSVMKTVSASQYGLAAVQSLRTLMLGGESLPPALAREIKETLPCRLVNMYGPTETTIWSSTAEVSSKADSIHIGKPIVNTTMYVLDRHSSRPVPTGVVGELYIGGHGVACGYLNRPELTAERFLPDPFATLPGQRLYRTGDLARYLPDGNIDLLGREDNQVKIRGVRIELGEIEAALGEHPAVQQAVVAARRETRGDEKRLIAYLVSVPGQTPAAGDLRKFLKTRLQEAMIPSGYVFLSELPLTASGKVNRNLLPEPEPERAKSGVGFSTPTSECEIAIGSIWKRVLNLEEIGIDDNFFDLGGHSLRLVQVHGEITRCLRHDVPLVRLLEYPTIRALAAFLSAEAADDVTRNKDMSRFTNQQAAILRRQQQHQALSRAASKLTVA